MFMASQWKELTHSLTELVSVCVWERVCVFVSVWERECVCVCVWVCVCVCVLTTKSVLICFDILLMSLGSKRQRKVIGERKKENFSYFLKTFLFSERERKNLQTRSRFADLNKGQTAKKFVKWKALERIFKWQKKTFSPIFTSSLKKVSRHVMRKVEYIRSHDWHFDRNIVATQYIFQFYFWKNVSLFFLSGSSDCTSRHYTHRRSPESRGRKISRYFILQKKRWDQKKIDISIINLV